MDISVKHKILFIFLFLFSIGVFGQSTKVEQYRIEVNKYKQEANNNKVAYYLNKIAFIYWDLNNKDSAVYYFLEGIKYNQKVNNRSGVKATYSNIAMIYADNNLLDVAVDYAKKSLTIRRQLGKKPDICPIMG